MSQVPTPEQQLILAAMSAHQVNPGIYRHLVDCMRAFAEAQALAMVNCDLGDLPRLQGRAQSVASIAKLLSEAPSKGPDVQARIASR